MLFFSLYFLYFDLSLRGFSEPVQLNGIDRMHVKAPLATAKTVMNDPGARQPSEIS